MTDGAADTALTSADRRLPPELADRARSHLQGAAGTAVPRAAATVALLRDGPTGVEVYLLRRVTTMAFASGMHVFPGGGVDPRDAVSPSGRSAGTGWGGPSPERWALALGADLRTTRGLLCAAVRETFEECGVVLAGLDANDVVSEATDAGWEADREALIAHTLSFAEVLERRQLVLRTDLLRPWSRWITPEFEPRRYDTYIFLAALPTGQQARHVGGEADQADWIRPSDAVQAVRSGTMAMLPPTLATLIGLATLIETAAAPTAHAAMHLATGRSMAAILPRAVQTEGEARIVLPGEPGYDQ